MKATDIVEWYIFCGNYRKFVVMARTKDLAIAQFDIASQQGFTHGFYSKDITRICPKNGWKQYEKQIKSSKLTTAPAPAEWQGCSLTSK